MKMTMNFCAAAVCAAVFLMSVPSALRADETNGWEWVEVRDFGVEGMPFKDAVTPYGRLPKGFAGASDWARHLGRLSTGLSLRFAVDDSEVRLKCEIDPACWREATSDHYMTTFVNLGFDWYVWDDKRGEWVYENHLWPSKKDGSTDGVIRTRPGVPTLVNFPVRGEPLSVKIGIRRGHRLTRITSHKLAQKPVVHYGTSIVQGGCVCRPGLLFTAVAARLADVEWVNLGFSGAARMEMDMCTGVVARVDASLYILDCLWNMDERMVSERCEPFVRELRRLRPDVPILLCEDVRTDQRETEMGLKVRALHKKLVAEGWKGVYLLRTDEILPMDPDMTVDRCHPNDIGARIMAQVYADRVRKILGASCAGGEKYDVAAYVWPAYQPDPRWAELGIFKAGKGEWQNVWEAVPKWEGHVQPLKPLWGYENEADAKVVKRKIDAAVSHGVNVFIYDWYWYGGRPFLEDALDKGFLGAKNNEKMRFFVMWANHHVNWLWDNTTADKRWGAPRKDWLGFVTDEEFRAKLVPRWISQYFGRPNYYRIGGKPVLMIYEVGTFVQGVGGVEKAAAAIAYLRAEAVRAGLGGVHLMACDFGLRPEWVKALGIDSATIYNLVHWSNPAGNPDYADWAKRGAARFDSAKRELGVAAYFPHASVGWDTNPRYPKGSVQPTAVNSTPEKFEQVLRRAKAWSDANPQPGMPKLITVNSWNEWTEGSYLEPDTVNGFGYLEAVRRVVE